MFTEKVVTVVFFFLSCHFPWLGFGGRGILPGVATGSGLGPQTGVLMLSMSVMLDHHILVWRKCLQIKTIALFLAGAGVLGQGGTGPGGAGSKCHKVLNCEIVLYYRFLSNYFDL